MIFARLATIAALLTFAQTTVYAEDNGSLRARMAACPAPYTDSVHDRAVKYRYTHFTCPSELSNAFVVNVRERVSDGGVEDMAAVIDPTGYVVFADGPLLFWVDSGDNMLYRTDMATGTKTAITSARDDNGFLILPTFSSPGDGGFYAWHYIGDMDHKTLWHIREDGSLRELGPQDGGDDTGFLTLPTQVSEPAVTYTDSSRFLTGLRRSLDGTALFDADFFKRNPAIQTATDGYSQFFASDDGQHVVSSLATGLYEPDHPEYPQGAQVVMIDKVRGIKTFKVSDIGNLGLEDSGISPDGRYFYVKMDGGFDIREFWTAKLVYTYRPKVMTTGNPGDIAFIAPDRVAVIDGDAEAQVFTFLKP